MWTRIVYSDYRRHDPEKSPIYAHFDINWWWIYSDTLRGLIYLKQIMYIDICRQSSYSSYMLYFWTMYELLESCLVMNTLANHLRHTLCSRNMKTMDIIVYITVEPWHYSLHIYAICHRLLWWPVFYASGVLDHIQSIMHVEHTILPKINCDCEEHYE